MTPTSLLPGMQTSVVLPGVLWQMELVTRLNQVTLELNSQGTGCFQSGARTLLSELQPESRPPFSKHLSSVFGFTGILQSPTQSPKLPQGHIFSVDGYQITVCVSECQRGTSYFILLTSLHISLFECFKVSIKGFFKRLLSFLIF